MSERSGSDETILGLIMSYGELQDAADFETLADLFTHGAFIVEGVAAHRGRDAVLASKSHHDRVYDDGTLRTKHIVSNIDLQIDEAAGRARATSYFTVYQATPALPLQCLIAGRYHDTFHRIDGRWWFDERLVLPDLVGNLSGHIEDNPLAGRGAS
jgi:hypothetical protein